MSSLLSQTEQLTARFPNASASFLKANAGKPIMGVAAFAPFPRSEPPRLKSDIKTPPRAKEPAKHRIRQNSAGLNKTEQAFKDYLDADRTGILSQSVTLKIGNGVRYTPDFFCPADATNGHENPVTECLAWEVKGFMRDDAAVKLKVAASLYPWIKFHLVTRKKGEWQIQEILP